MTTAVTFIEEKTLLRICKLPVLYSCHNMFRYVVSVLSKMQYSPTL